MRRFHSLLAGGSLLLALLLLGGCAKDGPTLVQGQVVDKDTGQPVPRAEVQVHAFAGGGGGAGGGYGPALGGPYLADAAGQFAFSFEASKHTTYRLDAYGPLGHFSVDDGVEVRNGQTNRNLRLPVQAPGWVRIKLIDEPPRANSGLILVGGFGNPGYSSGLPFKQDTTFIRYIIANHPVRVSWEIQDHVKDNKIEGAKDLVISSLDTVTVEVRF